ncbi:FtsX-like permease family protein [Streptomyces sp. NPDC086010]|uniref:ABC transporter permease n=1 Tax=Streptomyces sp. NPDC086010 TaxID=3365745 RepID=UPI0037D4F463
MRAILRWARSDLRSHRGEALFMVLATTGIVTSLMLATALIGYATDPWQRVFTQSRAAHVWLHTDTGADTGRLAREACVESVAGPYPTASVTVSSGGIRASVELRGTPARAGADHPPLVAGDWLSADRPDGAVLESRLALALMVRPGDTLTLPGTARRLTVAGIADSAEPRYRPGERPGLVWALPSAVISPSGQVTGLRLSNPADTEYAVQRAVTLLGAGMISEVSTWREARAEAQGDSRLLGQVLGLFGLGALVAAAFAVHGAIVTRIRGHLRNISVLKAIGFTPSQVVRVFLVQHVVYALLGAAAAAALAETLGRRLPGRLGDAVRLWRELPGHTTALIVVPVAAVLFIATTTALAAWRAGRVPPVPVSRPPALRGGRLSGTARGALELRIPPPVVLGWHRAFGLHARPLATIGRLVLPLLLIVVAMSAWTTLERAHDSPERIGLPAALTVRADPELDQRSVLRLLESDPQVTAAHPAIEVAALVPGQTATITLRGIGTEAEPYPYRLAEGRAARGPDEAVAGQGLLDLLDARVGDWVRVTVGERPQILHLVGRGIEPENAGRVVTASVDTLRANDPLLRPTLHRLSLTTGADPQEVAERIVADSHSRLDVYTVPNPADGLSPLRGVVLWSISVLALIGLVELLTVIGGTVREGEKDLLALKAMGLSPRQIVGVTVTATGCTALAASVCAVAAGLPLARWLIDTQGRSSGIGAGIAQLPSPALLTLLVTASVLGAAALAAVPASRAADRRLAATLSAVA